jgi:bifunctional non-homologous end joining protein LigD
MKKFLERGTDNRLRLCKCINSGQEFVIGGFTPGTHGLDSVIVGYYRGEDLVYVARTRNGFVSFGERQVFA